MVQTKFFATSRRKFCQTKCGDRQRILGQREVTTSWFTVPITSSIFHPHSSTQTWNSTYLHQQRTLTNGTAAPCTGVTHIGPTNIPLKSPGWTKPTYDSSAPGHGALVVEEVFCHDHRAHGVLDGAVADRLGGLVDNDFFGGPIFEKRTNRWLQPQFMYGYR